MTHLEQYIAEEMKDRIFDISLDYFMNYLMSDDDSEDILIDVYLSEIDVGNWDEGEMITKAILQGISDYHNHKIKADNSIDAYISSMQQSIKEYYNQDEYISLLQQLCQLFHVSSLDVGSDIENVFVDDINQLSFHVCDLFKESEILQKQFACCLQILMQKLLILQELNQTDDDPEPIIYDYLPSIIAIEAIMAMNAYTFITNNKLSILTKDVLGKNLGILACNEYDQYNLVRSIILEKDYLGHSNNSNEYMFAIENDKMSLSVISIWELIIIFGNNCEYIILSEPELFYCVICDIFISMSHAANKLSALDF
ncbi:MAG: hypothetical protein LUG46_02960 [Erysipelotrichaceae bacterium]|nr:hypothetical protein [Erysipelotrichaceae bacterium]